MRRAEAAELRLRGKSQLEIATQLGVSQKTISLDLAKIDEDAIERAAGSADLHRAREIAKLDFVERLAFESYWISRQDSVTKKTVVERAPQWSKKKGEEESQSETVPNKTGKTTTKPTKGKMPNAKLPVTKVGDGPLTKEDEMRIIRIVEDEVRKGQAGDAAFLGIMTTCMRDRCKLLGIAKDATEHNTNIVNNQTVQINWNDLFKRPDEVIHDPIDAKLKQIEQDMVNSSLGQTSNKEEVLHGHGDEGRSGRRDLRDETIQEASEPQEEEESEGRG